MDQALADVFEQARGLVADADRKLAEAEEHRKAQEREAVVTELAIKVDAAFDFTSKEKLQLEQRLDMQDGRGRVEFVVRAARAISAPPFRKTSLEAFDAPGWPGTASCGRLSRRIKKGMPLRGDLAAARIVTRDRRRLRSEDGSLIAQKAHCGSTPLARRRSGGGSGAGCGRASTCPSAASRPSPSFGSGPARTHLWNIRQVSRLLIRDLGPAPPGLSISLNNRCLWLSHPRAEDSFRRSGSGKPVFVGGKSLGCGGSIT